MTLGGGFVKSSYAIESEVFSIRDVFIRYEGVYMIPTFQREFVWREEEIKVLFEDWSDHTEGFSIKMEKLDGYLLGNIVLVSENDSRKSVVDGQQRLTTLTLIIKVLERMLMSKLSNTKDETKIRYINRHLNDIDTACGKFKEEGMECSLEELKIQHESELSFGKSYRSIMENEKIECIQNKTVSDSNIKSVYETIESILEQWNEEELVYLKNYIMDRVVLIYTQTPSMAKAFQLFEVLNDRGKSLEALDLIKNLFLKKLDRDQDSSDRYEKFTENWDAFIKNLRINNKKRIPGSDFLKHYLIGKEGKNVKKNKLFDYYVDQNKGDLSPVSILELSVDLNQTSEIYANIERENYQSFLADPEDKLMYILFKVLGGKQVHSLLIPFYNEKDEKAKKRLLDTVVRWYASVIFSFSPTNTIEKQIPKLVQNYNNNVKGGVNDALDILINELEADIKDKAKRARSILSTQSFKTKDNKANQKAQKLLYFIELYTHKNISVTITTKKQKPTVEHILSRKMKEKYSDLGMEDESDFLSCLNLLGNLTLLEKEKNSSAGDRRYKDKLKNYQESNFILAKTLAGNIKSSVKSNNNSKIYRNANKYLSQQNTPKDIYWTKEKIISRTEQLAEYVYRILCNEWE